MVKMTITELLGSEPSAGLTTRARAGAVAEGSGGVEFQTLVSSATAEVSDVSGVATEWQQIRSGGGFADGLVRA